MIVGPLCLVHHRIRQGWLTVTYDPSRPGEWPGLRLMDCRTPHADRLADWDRKTAEQVAACEALCRSGESLQCGGVDAKHARTGDPDLPLAADPTPHPLRTATVEPTLFVTGEGPSRRSTA